MAKPRNVIRMPGMPTRFLINALVERGDYPRRIAERMMDSPELVLEATVFYYDCIEADSGDRDAKARIDRVREQVQSMRRAEIALGNDPDIGPRGPVRGRIGMPEPVTRQGSPQAPLSGPPVPSKGELRRLSEQRGPKPSRESIVLPPGVRLDA